MALQFIEGYDAYDPANAGTDLSPGKWDARAGTFVNITTGRLGVGRAMNYTTAATSTTKSVSNLAVFIFGVAFKMVATPSAEDMLIVNEGGTQQFKVTINAARKLEVYDAASALQGTSTTAFTVGTWYYMEVKGSFVGTGAVGSVEVKVEGTQEINATTIDIVNGSNVYCDEFQLLGNTADIHYDDMYVCDATGALNNDFLGDSRIDIFFPDADDSIQWTALVGTLGNYEDVDDNPSDEDTTYVFSSTAPDIDLYTTENMDAGVGTVHGVQVVARGRKLDAGTRNIKLKAVSGATTQTSAAIPLSTTYANYPIMYEDSDGGGTAWTKTLVDAMKIGIEVA